jgi:uncharacterized protein YjbJ (UPF0337 family)
MWNKDEMKGKLDEAKGRGKEAVGDLGNDDNLRDKGAAENAGGQAQEAWGKGKRKVGEAVEDVGDKLKE